MSVLPQSSCSSSMALAFGLAGYASGSKLISVFASAAGNFFGNYLCDPNNYGQLQNPNYNPSDDLPGLPPGMFDDPPPPSDPPPPDPGGASDGCMGDAGDALLPPGGLLSPLALDLDRDGVELTTLPKPPLPPPGG